MPKRPKRTVSKSAPKPPQLQANKPPTLPATDTIGTSVSAWQQFWEGAAKHKMVIAIVGVLGILAGAALSPLLGEHFQSNRETANAKTASTTAISNATRELGSFLESVLYHPERAEALFTAHEAKMNDLMTVLLGTNVALGARDLAAKDRLEVIVLQVTYTDSCLTKIYSGYPAGEDRQQAFRILYENFIRDTARLATNLPAIANGKQPQYWVTRCLVEPQPGSIDRPSSAPADKEAKK